MPKFVFLYTDIVIWMSLVIVLAYCAYVVRHPSLREKWTKVSKNGRAVLCAGVLSVFFTIALLDSIHYRPQLDVETVSEVVAYQTRTVSLMDDFLETRIAARERSYSAPFATREFDKTTRLTAKGSMRDFAPLKARCGTLDEDKAARALANDVCVGVAYGFMLSGLLFLVLLKTHGVVLRNWRKLFSGWKRIYAVWLVVAFIVGLLVSLWPTWHVLGTDTTGNDVLYVALKSVRTAITIGILATLSMLPLAILLGMMAGYFKGWVDDVIQYVYTTLSSIPSVLLIAASVLMIQVYIDKNPSLYETGLERADLRLFLLAAIIGLTGWSGLARLLRAETLKVSAMDFVLAAKAFGVSPIRILMRHVFPNVAHIVLIVAVLDFSGIVLYEAVLSYVGIGVDPLMQSFGSMINAAAVEMSRSPVIWWNLLASFVFMVALVLAANLFASGVRDAFDPHSGEV